MPQDPRRQVPRTDVVLADPRLIAAAARLGQRVVKEAVAAAQARARTGEIPADLVTAAALADLPELPTSFRTVINATGVVLHTNLGRAPLSNAAIDAVVAAARYVDVEYDVQTGRRAKRGRGALDALLSSVPDAEDALVVNNGAGALVLATTALAGGREVVLSRGEMVEIGDGFRLPDLIESTGTRLREVGTTNRTSLLDYVAAVGPSTGCVLKVHPSNFRIAGFTSTVSVSDLATLAAPLVVDVGSGLLVHHRLLPDEPDVTTALRSGAGLVTCSADKLLGGPQAGLIFGGANFVETVRRHPLARALRVDKLTLAALEATLRGPDPPTIAYLHANSESLRQRTERLAVAVAGEVVASAGAVGGGGAPGQVLSGWAVALPVSYAEHLRRGEDCIVTRIERGRCLVDLRCVPASEDDRVREAVLRGAV